jgi:hypothetical protein
MEEAMTKRALCIGINNYPGTHMDLKGCVNDANDWAAELGARGFAVKKLLDSQATKVAMVDAFRTLIGEAVNGDVVVITYSGHGTYVPDINGDEVDGLDEALCPYDLQTGGAALLDDEIHEMFAARKQGVRVVLISDSCHSGTVTRAAAADPDAGDAALHADGQLAPGGQAATWRQRQAAGDRSGGYRPVAVRRRDGAERRPAAVGLQGRAEQLQLRRDDQEPPQRRLHLLYFKGAEVALTGGDLLRLARCHQSGVPAFGVISAKPADRGQCCGAQAEGIRLT